MVAAVVAPRTGFFKDEEFARAVGDFYGRYIATFESDHHQVHAHLFERDGFLIAHVSFAPGFEEGQATDPYVSRLAQYARETGYERRLQLIFS